MSWLGTGWIPPGWTEFRVVKLMATTEAVNVIPAAVLSRETKATSDGELTRVGTVLDGGFVESSGKTR